MLQRTIRGFGRFCGSKLLGFVCVVIVAGCQMSTTGREPQASVLLESGIRVTAPSGFCVETQQTQTTGQFVLLASCAAIGDGSQRRPPIPAVMTVLVADSSEGGSITEAMPMIEAFFATPSGRATLARSGRGENVEVVETRKRRDVFYIRARDTSRDSLKEIDDAYWRALFDLRGRMVTVTVLGVSGRPVPSEAGFDALELLVRRLKLENSAK